MSDNPGRLIAMLHRKAQIFWTQSLKEAGIGISEYPILLLLYRKDGITQEEISQNLLLDKSSVTRAVQSLLKKGLIKRERDEKDHRCNRIFLTDKADDYRCLMESVRVRWNNILQDHMSNEEKEIFTGLLNTAAQNAKEWKRL